MGNIHIDWLFEATMLSLLIKMNHSLLSFEMCIFPFIKKSKTLRIDLFWPHALSTLADYLLRWMQSFLISSWSFANNANELAMAKDLLSTRVLRSHKTSVTMCVIGMVMKFKQSLAYVTQIAVTIESRKENKGLIERIYAIIFVDDRRSSYLRFTISKKSY